MPARRTAAWLLLWVCVAAGCAPHIAPPPPTAEPAPPAADSLATSEPAPPESLALADSLVVVDSLAADTSEVVVAEPPAEPPEKPADPWRLIGEQIKGTREGVIEIDRPYIRHGELVISARSGIWYAEEDRAELHDEVEIRDTVRVMHARQAFYQRSSSLLIMEGDVDGEGLSGAVILEEEGRTLSANWLRYDIPDSVMHAGGDLKMTVTDDSVDVFGDEMHFDRRAHLATVVSSGTRRPHLVRAGSGTDSPFEMEADTLRFHTDDLVSEAFGDVVFTRGSVAGTCERAVYSTAQDHVVLSGHPHVGDADGWVTGETMVVSLREGFADKLIVRGGARTEYFPPERPGEVHFAVGDSLTAFLDAGGIRSALVEGRAAALYLPATRDREQRVGLNWTRGQRLRLLMGASEVRRVQFEGEVTGRYVLPSAARPDSVSGPDTWLAADTVVAGGLDSLQAPDTVAVAAPEAPDSLAAIRQLARRGTLEPGDSLLIALGFDPRETVAYRGERLDFDVATDQLAISENGQVIYRGMELHANEIVFDTPRDLIIARGEPVLKDKDSEVHGTEMTFRIDTRKGLVFQGRSEFEGGYYRGDRIKRVEDRTFFVSGGDFSSCDLEETHFHMHASKMKIIAGKRVVGKPVVLYIGNIPIFIIPFAAFPIERGRRSGLLVPDIEIGLDTSRGRFIRNLGYYLSPNDYVDALLWLDYYERDPRITFNGRFRYNLRYVLNGNFEGSYTKQDYDGVRTDRWLVRVAHDQVLGNRFNLKVSGNFQSDKDYGGDRNFDTGVDDRLTRTLRSTLSLNKSWSIGSLSLAMDRTENLDEGTSILRIVQDAPVVRMSINSFPLGVKPDDRGRGGRLGFLANTYLQSDARYVNVYRKDWEETVDANQAAGLNTSLSDRRRILGGLNITPSLRFSAAWAQRDDAGRRNRTGATWSAGLSGSGTVYGTFFPRIGTLEGLRHVLEMSAGYSYRPEIPSIEGFPNVGGISLGSSKASAVSLRMTQRLHLKWLSGEKAVKKENLLIWTTSTGYDFLARDRDREPWADMSHNLRLDPGKTVRSELSLVHDLQEWRRRRLQLRTTMHLKGGGGAAIPTDANGVYGGFGDPGESDYASPGARQGIGSLTGPWSLTATHVFGLARGWDSHSSSINLATDLSLTRSWRFKYSLYYDLVEDRVSSQGYTLYRDLHCWEMRLERRSSGGRSSYYLRINVKDLPDLKYERSQGR
jgi:lipopolysaccharide export system protein LptA